jgi:carbonic anhydrase
MRKHTKESLDQLTPQRALDILMEGNQRFVSNLSKDHDHLETINETRDGQFPFAVVLSCMDSRTSVELIFDQGLGDLFSIRVAGNIVNEDILGSIEYAVTVLDVPLIVVLGHDSCGAVQATLAALDEGKVPSGFVRDVVERVTPSIMLGRRDGLTRVDEFEARHVIETGSQLRARSIAIAERIGKGELAIAGVTYLLADGRIVLREHIGDIGEAGDD